MKRLLVVVNFMVLVVGMAVLYPHKAETQSLRLAAASPYASLSDAATIIWSINGAYAANATVTIAGNRTLNITGPVSGGTYLLKVVQDGTGSRTLTLGSGCSWKVISGGAGAITLSTAANSIDIISFSYDGANCYANLGKNYS